MVKIIRVRYKDGSKQKVGKGKKLEELKDVGKTSRIREHELNKRKSVFKLW